MIIDISVAVIALAFVALVIYLIVVIKALRITLGQVNHTLVEVRKQVESLNPIFNAVNQTGQILEYKATALKKDLLDSSQEESDLFELARDGEKKKRIQTKGLMTVAAILELAGIGVSLWEKLKKRR